MSAFSFPDLEKSFQLVKTNKVSGAIPKVKLSANDLDSNNVVLVKSELTVYLEDTLLFMQNNNLIPDLPQNINIKYINTS